MRLICMAIAADIVHQKTDANARTDIPSRMRHRFSWNSIARSAALMPGSISGIQPAIPKIPRPRRMAKTSAEWAHSS
jgi:hypothetical protein